MFLALGLEETMRRREEEEEGREEKPARNTNLKTMAMWLGELG